MTLGIKGLLPRTQMGTSSHCLLLSGASDKKWARRIKSREPFGGTMSDLSWSSEVKDNGQNGQGSQGA